LLGELVLYGCVEIADGGVLRVVATAPPADALAHATLELLLAQSQHRDVRTWLAYLADTSVEAVAHRLVVAGVWQRREKRRLGGPRVSHSPVDANVVAWRAMRLTRLLTRREPIAVEDAMLAGLVAVTKLVDVVLWHPEHREAGNARINAELARLPWSLHHLLAFTDAATGELVLTPH
jgi:hypothetical protein